MKKVLFLLLIIASFQAVAQKNTDTRVFELRIYYAEPGKLDALIQRFRQHTRKLFKQHGMENIAYWLPLDNEKNQLIYVLAYPSLEAREASWKAFQADPKWVSAKAQSEVKGKLVNHVESFFMKATDFSPQISTLKKQHRIYEITTCEVKPGKMDELLAQFRDHTMRIWTRYGVSNVAYWTTIEKENTTPKLIYILAHKNKASAAKAHYEITLDPEWIKVQSESERNGKLLGKTESDLMKAVLFSK